MKPEQFTEVAIANHVASTEFEEDEEDAPRPRHNTGSREYNIVSTGNLRRSRGSAIAFGISVVLVGIYALIACFR